MTNYILEPYTDEYYDFVYETRKELYQEYIERHYRKWDENREKDYFKVFMNTYKKTSYIIKLDNVPIGFYQDFTVDNGTYEIVNICLKPEYQRKGIGTKILKEKIQEHSKQKIKIEFFKSNPVISLFRRFCFILMDIDEFNYVMERDPMDEE